VAIDRPSITGREFNKFVESPSRPGETAVEVVGSFASEPGPFAPPQNSDYILRSVSGAVETYTYYNGGPSGTLLQTVVVTYSGPDLSELISVEVS
jgi:hypothetical protein